LAHFVYDARLQQDALVFWIIHTPLLGLLGNFSALNVLDGTVFGQNMQGSFAGEGEILP
jgi:hypothetical protein